MGESRARGSPAAMVDGSFATIYEQFYDGVRRTLVCLGVPAAAVDDAVQEVFLVVHRRVAGSPPGTVVREWIYGVTRRVAWRHYRSSARADRRRLLVEPPEDLGSPERALEREEAVDFMTAFLDTLDVEQRTVFVLAEIEELTAREVAAIVGASPNTIASRLRLARGKFAAALQRRARRGEQEVRRGR